MAAKKPNILILWGDDIGIWNISHFSRGMMGYRTPNIDRTSRVCSGMSTQRTSIRSTKPSAKSWRERSRPHGS